MNSRERTRRAVVMQDVDRLPASIFATTLEREMDIAYALDIATLEELYAELHIDTWRNRVLPVYIGKGKNNVSEGHPWAECHSIDKADEFRFPTRKDFNTDGMMEELAGHNHFYQIAGTITEGYICGPYQLYLDMCGQEQGLMLLKLDPKLARAMIDRVFDYWIEYTIAVLDAGWRYIDAFHNDCDFATQRGLMISHADFTKFFLPGLRRLSKVIRGYGISVMQHTCGAMASIIPDLIDIGTDILNPIQTSADGMVIETLHAEYYKRICFFGGIDTQHLMTEGTPNEVAAEVRRLKSLFSTGCIICPSHEIRDDVPMANVMALYGEVG